MPKWGLISTSLPDLLPMRNRSPGIHVSDVIHDLCVRLGHYKRSPHTENTTSRWQLGCALEDAIAERFARDAPSNYMRGFELQQDGLYLTPDLLHVEPSRLTVVEVKLTWVSSRNWPVEITDCDMSQLTHNVAQQVVAQYKANNSESSTKTYFKYELQLAAYCYALQTCYGQLITVMPMGAYRYDEFEVHARTWNVEFTPEELRDRWKLLLQYAEEMKCQN